MPLGQVMIVGSGDLMFGGQGGPGFSWGVSNVIERPDSFYNQHLFDNASDGGEPVPQVAYSNLWKEADGNPFTPGQTAAATTATVPAQTRTALVRTAAPAASGSSWLIPVVIVVAVLLFGSK